jgi:isoprenylcysteine carboxyl methyltransferase (ICMT) family protein YpbQ
MMLTFFVVALLFRLALLALSLKHEKALKQQGAIEIGGANSRLLAGMHLVFYLAGFAEGLYRQSSFDKWSVAGIAIFAFSAAILLFVVRLLGRLWTVKLLIAPDHQLVEHPLFRVVRHPNYYLNLLPELTGYALFFHASITFFVVMPLYLIPLIRRIRQEEEAMSQRFDCY